MKVGDLIVSQTRYQDQVMAVVDTRHSSDLCYQDQVMAVVDTRHSSDLFGAFQQIRAVSLNTAIETRWCNAKIWKVLSESR